MMEANFPKMAYLRYRGADRQQLCEHQRPWDANTHIVEVEFRKLICTQLFDWDVAEGLES